VEFVQIGIPGRDPALQDLVLNALGGVTGVFLASRGLGRWGRRLTVTAAALAWLAPLALLIPKTTPHDLYGLWTPRFGRTARYEGRIAEAATGALPIPSRMVDDKTALDVAITGRDPIRLRLTAGPAPRGLAPVFQIVDGHRQGVLELHALGHDLILRGYNPARILKLDQPDARWAGAMTDVPVGDTVTLVVDRSRGSVCMSVDDRERCNLAPSLGDGWGHVLNVEGPPVWFRATMALAWAVGLGGLIGLTASRRAALSVGVAVAVVGYLGTVISPDVRPSLVHAVMLVAGTGLGALLRAPTVRLWGSLRPS
jgi:hypothetical protein